MAADGADTYEVEELLAERIRDKGGRVLTEYLVKWVGYSTEDNTWEPHRHILDVELMHRFEARRCAPPGLSAKQRGLGVGTIVEANWQAEGRWFPGRVAAVHTSDTCAVTFNVDYQDGDFEEGVCLHDVRFATAGKTLPTPPDHYARAIVAIHKRLWCNGQACLQVSFASVTEKAVVCESRVPPRLVSDFDRCQEAGKPKAAAPPPPPPLSAWFGQAAKVAGGTAKNGGLSTTEAPARATLTAPAAPAPAAAAAAAPAAATAAVAAAAAPAPGTPAPAPAPAAAAVVIADDSEDEFYDGAVPPTTQQPVPKSGSKAKQPAKPAAKPASAVLAAPTPPPAASRAPRAQTLGDMVARIKREMQLDEGLAFGAAVRAANEQVGLEAKGTLAQQVAALLEQLGLVAAPPAVAEMSAAPAALLETAAPSTRTPPPAVHEPPSAPAELVSPPEPATLASAPTPDQAADSEDEAIAPMAMAMAGAAGAETQAWGSARQGEGEGGGEGEADSEDEAIVAERAAAPTRDVEPAARTEPLLSPAAVQPAQHDAAVGWPGTPPHAAAARRRSTTAAPAEGEAEAASAAASAAEHAGAATAVGPEQTPRGTPAKPWRDGAGATLETEPAPSLTPPAARAPPPPPDVTPLPPPCFGGAACTPAATCAPAAACAPCARAEEWMSRLPARWGLGVIIGPTGAGKSRAIEQLRAAGLVHAPLEEEHWPADQAVISAIAASPLVQGAAAGGMDAFLGSKPSADKCAELAIERLSSVGLNSLPVWLRPYSALSNGQRARSAVARSLASGCSIDDFAATVDAKNASVCAAGIARLVKRRKLSSVVLASVHPTIVPWTGADWAFFPQEGRLLINPTPAAKPRVAVVYDEATFDVDFASALPPPPPPPPLLLSKEVLAAKLFAPQGRTLSSEVVVDVAMTTASNAFDVDVDGKTSFVEPRMPPLPPGWRVGLLVGASGTGKSTVLRRLAAEHGGAACAADLGGEGEAPPGTWPTDACAASALSKGGVELVEALGGRALGEAARARPFAALSRGERTLLATARACADAAADGAAGDGAAGGQRLLLNDEFTSFLDREVAARAAHATGAFWRRRAAGGQLVCATVHADLVPTLRPDWVFDTHAQLLTKYSWAEDGAAAEPLP